MKEELQAMRQKGFTGFSEEVTFNIVDSIMKGSS
jgi:hypothetical protein